MMAGYTLEVDDMDTMVSLMAFAKLLNGSTSTLYITRAFLHLLYSYRGLLVTEGENMLDDAENLKILRRALGVTIELLDELGISANE